jgi:hypothetical protein
MLTHSFFYFLLICEMAALGLLFVGIIMKVRSILKNYYLRTDD